MTTRPHRRLRGPRATAAAAPGAGGRSQPRSLTWRIATPVVGVLSGALFVVSAHSSEGTDLRPGRYTDLASLVRGDSQRVDALKKRVAGLNQDVAALTGAVGNKQVERVSRQADSMKSPAGLAAVTGPGVTVTLSDASQTTTDNPPDNLNLLVVHQQDIQAVVNAMWKGGAQAITIQGQRVVSTTGIRCVGNSVQLQGVPYGQPYVIAAVGDTTTITDAIDQDSYLQYYRADAADPDIAVGWDERVQSRVVAPAYDGLVALTYATVLPAADSAG